MIIFGWGHVTNKQYGATLADNCSNCNNDSWWHLLRNRKWFTLFFIPVIPYKTKYFLMCPVCSQAVELTSSQVERARQLNVLTQGLLNKSISENEYRSQAEKIEVLG